MKLRDLKEASGVINPMDWLKKHVRAFDSDLVTWNPDGSVDYDGNVILDNISRIEVPFNHVQRFMVHSGTSSLSSLKNAPRRVTTFDVRGIGLTTLEHCPESVHHFFADDNKLQVVDHLPKEIRGSINLEDNPIKSLTGIHKVLNMENGIGHFLLSHCPIERDILGLILVKGLKSVKTAGRGTRFDRALEIIAPHFGKGRAAVLTAQQELIDAGLEEFANL